MSTFKERLATAIRKRGIKQSILAYKTGIDKSYISKYLSGKYDPKFEKLKK